eukprot:3607105-Alexandrium_andersonii.AAC.1
MELTPPKSLQQRFAQKPPATLWARDRSCYGPDPTPRQSCWGVSAPASPHLGVACRPGCGCRCALS